MFHGIPIHIIRDVFLTTRSFVKRITDFFKYRNATRDMNARYPDATAEELARDGTCIICREEMQPWIPHEHQPGQRRPTRTIIDERQRPKKLPCGHVLHFGCLRSWLERQQVCPTCRSSVLGPPAAAPNRTQHNQLGAVGQNAHQPQVPGQAGAAQPGAANGAAPQRPRNAARARTFQLGTWRFTMAMGNEQQIQETMNQLRNRDHQEQNPPNSRVANQSRNPAVHGITEAIEGIRNAAPLQEQIARIERQISREITSLSAAQEQLALVRALQSELTRLRGQPDPASAGVVPPIPNVAAIGQSMSGFRPTPTASHMGFMNQPYVLPQQQGFASTSTQVLGPGHADLPAGMVLPEGWNMLPLQAINQHVHASASSSRARSNNGAVPANAVLLQTSMSNYNHAANNPAAPPPPQQQQQPHPHATTTQPPQERVSRHPLLRPTSPPPQRGMSPFTASRLAQQPHIAPSSPYPPHSQAQSIVSTPNTSPFSAHQRLQQYQQQTQQALQAQQDQQPPAHTWPTDDQASTSHYPYQQTPVALAPPAVAAQAEEEIISGLPNWGSSEQSTSTSNQNGGFNGGNDSADAPETSHDRKGKGKAATVEDGMEEDNMD
jgi:E3 ubiquitin-protein ligase synoviolin